MCYTKESLNKRNVESMDALLAELTQIQAEAAKCFNPMKKMELAEKAVAKSLCLIRVQSDLIRGLING